MDLADQLAQRGWVSRERVSVHQQAREEAERITAEAVNVSPKDLLGLLKGCTDVKSFKKAAKKVLLDDPHSINKVIKEAHRLKSFTGGKRLIWLLYQMRDRLPDYSAEDQLEERSSFLERALFKGN